MPASTSSEPAVWKRFFWLTAGTAAAIVGIIYGFVVLVDPWDILPLSPPLDRAPVTSNQRFAYPALARSPRFDSAVFGTSSSRLLRPASLDALFNAHFVNLAMNDATAYEQTRLMTVFLRAHPTVRTIIVGIDVRLCETGDRPKLSPRPFPEWMYGDNLWRGYGEMLNMFAVQEAGSEIIFLRRVEPGSANKSYGIEVARLAGLPGKVISRAREILRRHEQSEEKLSHELSPGAVADGGAAPGPPQQTSFTAIDESVLDAIRRAELDELTPLEALNLLAALQKQLS